jgi:hypothetical protein
VYRVSAVRGSAMRSRRALVSNQAGFYRDNIRRTSSETGGGHRGGVLHLGQIAAEQPGKAAVIMADSGRTVTVAELDATANRLAHVRYEAGLRPGRRSGPGCTTPRSAPSCRSTPGPSSDNEQEVSDDPHRD